MRPLRVEYCGEWYTVESGRTFGIGRESDLTIDDNPYLHRTFLTLSSEFGLWWLSNVGQLLSATVSDATGSVQAWVAPGAKLPLVFQTVHVMFSAGATTYDFSIHAEEDFYNTSLTAAPADGGTTILPVTLTTSQRQLVVAFAEQVRYETGLKVMAVGAILDEDHVNTILAAGRADLCAMARPHLVRPHLTLQAAVRYEHHEQVWPNSYLPAKPEPKG